ncbi:MAG TPA: AAA domain-containing protein [Polyangiaceae bacterium]|nr:AAA domain-containing protein [Polyangiaceae bacterium]
MSGLARTDLAPELCYRPGPPRRVMPSSARSPRQPPLLTREQGDEVLRYWLAALRLEEALSVRPQARRATQSSAVPRLEQPTSGQDYFKLPLDAALAQLLGQQTQLKRAFDGELCGFFETWLDGQYRRSDDEGELSHLLCFPVLHLPKGELSGLVRCGIRLRFASGEEKAFRVPTRAERQRNAYPLPPDQARLTRAPKAESAWPFFIDTRLLRQPLGVAGESIDALFEALRALNDASERDMLALLTTTLELAATRNGLAPESVEARAARLKASVAAESCELGVWIERLTAAVRRLLDQSGSRARVYAVGIVVDGTQAKTTWHLQREINALLDAEAGARWKVESPLGAYLTGRPREAGEAPQRALFPGPGLTPSQRAAAEHFWGSSLSAVQGPPGTGKTSLILHLCAEALVRQVQPMVDGGRMGSALFLIASSNNRAVDNVIEPLSGAELPLALRAGSRQACEQQLAAGLRRTLAWLKRAEGMGMGERLGRLKQASEAFRSLRAQLELVLAPRRQALERMAERARLERELESLSQPEADATAVGALNLWGVSTAQSKAILVALIPLEKRLQALSKLCEVAPGHAPLQALNRHFKRTKTRDLPGFEQALKSAGLTLELPLPPPPLLSAGAEQQLERWEEASELCLSRLDELRAGFERNALRARQLEQRERLRTELEALGAQSEPLPETPEHEPLARALFDAAVAVREAWAAEHAAPLGKAVATALRTVEQERSLRPLFRNEPDAARWLCRLFNIWGSTLLSLGNCFPSDAASVARLVIDEAGQCHPAHAVSALLRAESALVIGDVHQLAPVIELGADEEARLLRACKLEALASELSPYRVHADAHVSTQSVADRAVSQRLALVDHFRCQPEIIALSDALCRYGLTVHTERADRAAHAAYLTHPVALVDLRGEQSPLAGSWCNELELSETLALVESLLDGGVQPAEIAVITPYRGQLERLRRSFAERRVPLEYSPELGESGSSAQRAGVALGTVHRFQGGERSIVLFSSVITHPASLGFLNARPNLLNVAISRARHHFICLGHAAVLAQGPRTRLLAERAHALSPTAYGRGTQSTLFGAGSG